MNICDCFKHEYGYAYSGRCSGTKEMDWCSCGGDETKCNFYPEKRKKALGVMNTAEMWLKAQKDGKMYCSIDLAYSKKTGFVYLEDMTPWPMDAVKTIDEIFLWDDWKEVNNVLTIEEAELKYGIKIIR